MTKFLPIVIVCFAASCLLAGGLLVFEGGAAAGGTTHWDDFNRSDESPLTGWTNAFGTWEVVSNEARIDTYGTGNRALAIPGATDSSDQWACARWDQGEYNGLMFRLTSNADGSGYVYRSVPSASAVVRTCPTGVASCGSDITVTPIYNGDADNYVCVEMTGTSTDLEIEIWEFGSSTPPARSSWDSSADRKHCLCDSTPCDASNCDYSTGSIPSSSYTGTYVGMYQGANAAGDDDFDNFCASDSTTDTTGCTGY